MLTKLFRFDTFSCNCHHRKVLIGNCWFSLHVSTYRGKNHRRKLIDESGHAANLSISWGRVVPRVGLLHWLNLNWELACQCFMVSLR